MHRIKMGHNSSLLPDISNVSNKALILGLFAYTDIIDDYRTFFPPSDSLIFVHMYIDADGRGTLITRFFTI